MMVRRRLGRSGRGAGRALPARLKRLDREDLQAIALVVLASLAVVAVFAYVVANDYLRFLTPRVQKTLSAASAGPAGDTPIPRATLRASLGSPTSGRPSPTAASSSPLSRTQTAAPTTVAESDVLVEGFRLAPMGAFRDPSWRTSPAGTPLTIVALPTSVDRSLRLEVPLDGEPVIACRDVEPVPGRFTLQTTFRVDGERAAGRLMSVGIRQGVARLGRDDGGRLAFSDGETTTATELPIRTGDWYRMIVDVDPESGAYRLDAAAVDRAASPVRVRRAGLALGRPSTDTEGVCFTAAGASGASITIDEVRITAR
jgi:hypothetical protein